MKNFVLGFLVCAFLNALAAKAVEISFNSITLRDLYACASLCGNRSAAVIINRRDVIKDCFLDADVALQQRGR